MFSKYKYVYTVCKEQSITKAAEKLFISQPSLSVAIKNTEKKIGASLFERSGTGITLTEVGERYIEAAEKMLLAEKEFENKLNDIYNLECGNITVGGTNYLSSYVLPHIINVFRKKHPNINVNLVESKSSSIAEMVKDEDVDIIVDSFDGEREEYELFPLVKEHIFLCCFADHPINSKFTENIISSKDVFREDFDINKVKPLGIENFKDENFILLKKGNDMYKRAMAVFLDGDIKPNIEFFVDQLNISYALCEAGLGMCFITDTFLKYIKYHADMALYKIDTSHDSRTLYVGYKKNRYCTTAMREFILLAQEVVK